ncbi:GATA transcription factor 20-like protein [Cinnamomum micranthum f. kanehirae]|uniref:GATA transcription factor 20-like protein n=1 Tax=Cinnamomum micranthum f. kanehirae TaxID=337451 RepID=A0A3S3ML08_9MAGN|nr:GATA transcription factor 20-like protein [Cinnamomum micranthum f. kanehirae]
MFSATDSISDPLKQSQHAHDHQDHHYLQDIPQSKSGLDGKRPIKVLANGHEEMKRLLKVVRRRRRPTKEKVGVEICKADGVVLRVCTDCNTSETPLWRSGPAGPKSLCNACGIRYRKRRRGILDLHDLGRNVWMKKKKSQEKVLFLLQRKLEEDAEAAVLLMALSCGLFVHT